MQSGNQLGIYLRMDRATVVCLAPQGRGRKLLDCFSVGIEGEEQNLEVLCDRIAHACSERRVRFTEAAVALDCASFMQHAVHSEFRDPRKVASTVRFDTEEALATDVSDVAVSFRIAATDEEGAHLDVFTAPRPTLTDVIRHLQTKGIDPVAIDPDVYCLSRYLLQYANTQEAGENSTLYATLSDRRGYLSIVSGQRELLTLRTFLIGASQDRTSLLVRETMVTTALAGARPVRQVRVFDLAGELNRESIGERTAYSVGECDLAALAGVEPKALADCSNPVDFALAYGAALGLSDKANTVNLRNDHMPFLGQKMRLQKAVRFLSISLTILLLALGILFHSMLLKENQGREALREKLEPDYLLVMRGKTELPKTMRAAVNDLEGALRKIKAEKTGIGADQDSVSAKMTLILKALVASAPKTGLSIDTISISQTNIAVDGTTAGHGKTVNELFPAMEKEGLEVLSNRVDAEDDHDKFSVTLAVKKQAQGK